MFLGFENENGNEIEISNGIQSGKRSLLPIVKSMPHLRHLYLHTFPTHPVPSAVDFSPLVSLPHLRTIAIFSFPLSTSHFPIFSRLDQLSSLRLVDVNLSSIGEFSEFHFSRLANLTELDLSNHVGLSLRDVREIGQCYRLKRLDVSGSRIEVPMFDSLSVPGNFPYMTELNLSRCFRLDPQRLTNICYALAKTLLHLSITGLGFQYSNSIHYQGVLELIELRSLSIGGGIEVESVVLDAVDRCKRLKLVQINGRDFLPNKQNEMRNKVQQIRDDCVLDFDILD